VTVRAGRSGHAATPHPALAHALQPPAVAEDFHVHSLFSDGASTVAENVRVARQRGLRRICLVDHVRADTDWVPRFAQAVRAVRDLPGIDILSGVETVILDRTGRLDLPPGGMPGVDLVLIADEWFPADLGPVEPSELRAALRRGDITPREAVTCLAEATINALDLVPRPVLAHLFGVLPKTGLAETDVPDILLRRLADAASAAGALIEVNERWACPSARTLRAFASAGVPVVAGSDSHDCQEIGRYDSVTRTLRALAGPTA
jgi:putative hydrolase